jgi:hypothetical protein
MPRVPHCPDTAVMPMRQCRTRPQSGQEEREADEHQRRAEPHVAHRDPAAASRPKMPPGTRQYAKAGTASPRQPDPKPGAPIRRQGGAQRHARTHTMGPAHQGGPKTRTRRPDSRPDERSELGHDRAQRGSKRDGGAHPTPALPSRRPEPRDTRSCAPHAPSRVTSGARREGRELTGGASTPASDRQHSGRGQICAAQHREHEDDAAPHTLTEPRRPHGTKARHHQDPKEGPRHQDGAHEHRAQYGKAAHASSPRVSSAAVPRYPQRPSRQDHSAPTRHDEHKQPSREYADMHTLAPIRPRPLMPKSRGMH